MMGNRPMEDEMNENESQPIANTLPLNKYESDKLEGYLNFYKPILDSYKDKPVYLLELGIHKGGSLIFWRDYMNKSIITGIDIDISKIVHKFEKEDRIQIAEGDQTDIVFLSQVAEGTAPDGYDIIIDDASHVGSKTKTSFWHLFDNHLKPGGYYFIEDWGTGYWDDYHDGGSLDLESYRHNKESLESHNKGMVGFIKQLVDETGAADATRKRFTGMSIRPSKFEFMTIYPGVVVVKKKHGVQV